jgi:hypothetical protein
VVNARIYEGIHFRFADVAGRSGTQRQLEYDFVVSPGADPGSITLEFQGPNKTELD